MSDNATNGNSRTDWDRLAHMEDDEIDTSDIPPLEEAFFQRARVYIPRDTIENMVQLDTDVAHWFRAQGKEYAIIINKILRAYIEAQSK